VLVCTISDPKFIHVTLPQIDNHRDKVKFMVKHKIK